MSAANTRVLREVEFIVKANSRVLSRRFPMISRDDLAQEGRRIAVEQLAAFDPTRGATFVTFCYPRIVGGMLNYATKNRDFTAKLFATELGLRDEEPPPTSLGLSLDPPREALVENLRGRIAAYMTAVELDERVPSAEDLYRSAAREHRVRAAVARLPEEEATFVRLFYEQGLSIEEVAAAMGVSTRTADRIHLRLKKELEKRLLEDLE